MLKHVARSVYLAVLIGSVLGCQEDDATVDDSIAPAEGEQPLEGGRPSSAVDASTSASDAAQQVSPAVDAGLPTSADAAPPDGTRDAPDATAPQGSTVKPKCVKTDRQVMVIGDSYINWTSHNFPLHIKEESGQSWRMEAVGGFSLGSGGFGSIPGEFDSSIALDPDAHTVLMDGGGNDILIPDIARALPLECTSKGAAQKKNCRDIVTFALDAGRSLMKRAADKGIRDVVYFFYPHVPANTILSGDSPDEILDFALPLAQKMCADAPSVTGGKLRCTFIDMVPVFAGHKDWFNEDIHENDKGAQAMAKEIWRVMKSKCIGQKAPMDCCE